MMSKVQCLVGFENCTTERRGREKGGSTNFKKSTRNLRLHKYLALYISFKLFKKGIKLFTELLEMTISVTHL